MATPSPVPPKGPAHGLIETLVQRRRETAIGFFVVAGLLAVLWLWLGYSRGLPFAPVTAVLALLSVVLVLAGTWQLTRKAGEAAGDWQHARLLALSLGGGIGLCAVLFGLALTYVWWEQYLFGVGLAKWRAEWWRLALILGAQLGGFVLMFASLQLAQVDVRSSAPMRRLLFGYNSVLSGLLLLYVLGLVNVLAYVQAGPLRKFGETIDWTASNIYSLTDSSKNLLRGLEKPVKVYVFKTGADTVDTDVETLLNNCKAYTSQLEVEYLSPDRNTQRMNELQARYKDIERVGILLVYGTEPNEEHVFLPVDEMGKLAPRLSPADDIHFDEFDGENALMKKLRFLVEGKTRPVVYFTQGEGEMDLNNRDLRDRNGTGIGILRDRLSEFNYEVRELKFAASTKVPADAACIVIAHPEHFAPEAIQALRDYLTRPGLNNKKGRLVVCFDVVYDPRTGAMTHTGLEDLLAEYQVQVSDTHVLTFKNPYTAYPLDVLVVADPRNPKAFTRSLVVGGRRIPFTFTDTRVVRPAAAENPTAPGRTYQVDELLYAWGETGGTNAGVWEEGDLRTDRARAIADELAKLPPNDPKRQKLKPQLPVAVAVSDTSEGGTEHPAPCLVVYGDAAWLRNVAMREGSQNFNFDLFVTTLEWLRERTDLGKMAEPKSRKRFILERTDAFTMAALPAFLLCIAVVGLGAGIWVVRRR